MTMGVVLEHRKPPISINMATCNRNNVCGFGPASSASPATLVENGDKSTKREISRKNHGYSNKTMIQQEQDLTIDQLLELLEVGSLVSTKSAPAVVRPRKLTKHSKHAKFCGKSHKWAICPYNPERNAPGIICPVCQRYTTTLRDFGRCKQCLYGRSFADERRDKMSRWEAQAPEDSWNPITRAKTAINARVKPVVDYAKETVDSVADSIKTTASEFQSLGAKANNIVDSLTNFIAQFPENIPGSDEILSFAAGLIAVFTVFKSTDSLAARLASAGLFLSRYISVMSVLEWAVEKFSQMLPSMVFLLDYLCGKARGWVAQGPADGLLIASSGLVSILVGVFLKKIPAKQDFDSILRRVDLFPKAIRGANDIFAYVKALLTTAVEETCSALGIKNPLQSGLPEEVTTWMESAQALLTTKMSESTYTSAFADKVMNCYVQGTIVVKNLNLARADSAVVRHVSFVQSSISSLNNKLSHLGFTSGPRAEPLMVYLHGTSGKGKSGLTVPFFIELAKHDESLDATEWQKLIYMRCAENEYWDGARNDQPFLCYDDFGQQRDSAANPNVELFEIIRLANIVPYPAHMASLEEKGKTFLHPRCVLLTSNSRRPKIESLTYPDAFFRRMDITAEVDIKDEFCMDKIMPDGRTIRTLDTSKCLAAFDPRIYEFKIEAGETMDYRQFMTFVATKYDERMVKGAKVLRELNNLTRKSTDDIYTAIANGTLDDMVKESAKGTPWECQNGMELDPYFPKTGKSFEDVYTLCDDVVYKWRTNLIAPSEDLLDEVKATHRQLVWCSYASQEAEKRNLMMEKLDHVEMEIAAAIPTFKNGIVPSTIVGDMYKLFLFGKLPAQLWPELCNEDDMEILSYFTSQQNVMFNNVIWTEQNFQEECWDPEQKCFRKLTNFESFTHFLEVVNRLVPIYFAPAATALAVFRLNAADTNGDRFELSAVARAYKCMFYGRYIKNRKIDHDINDVVSLYVNKGAGEFASRLKTVNRKACVRISKLFVSTSDNCSKVGCPLDKSHCFTQALEKAVQEGIILQHELDELNQTPFFMEEIVATAIPESHGETLWEKIKETYFKVHQRILINIDSTPLKWAYVLITGYAIQKLFRFVCSLIWTSLRFGYEKIRSYFSKEPLQSEGVVSFLHTEYKVIFATKSIDPKGCHLCLAGKGYPSYLAAESFDSWKQLYLSRAGFINRFEYWTLRRMMTYPERFDLKHFRRLESILDDKVAPGFTHACLHGDVDTTKYFQRDSFGEEEALAYEREFYSRWNDYLTSESMSLKGDRAAKLKVESFSTKDPRSTKLNVESMSTKESRAQQLKVESFSTKESNGQKLRVEGAGTPVKQIAKLEKIWASLILDDDTQDLAANIKEKIDILQKHVDEFSSEGNPTAEAYFDAMKNIYADAKIMPEGMVDGNAWDIISKKLWSNQAIMAIQDGPEICKGMFVRGNCFLTYRHWLGTCKSDTLEMRFLDDRPYFKFNLKDCSFINYNNRIGETQDLLMVQFPRYCPQYPDITKFFIEKDALSKVPGRIAQLCGISELPNGHALSHSLQNLKLEALDKAEYEATDGTDYVCRSGYTYVAETKKGDCGSILILRDTAFEKKIVGIHTAGRTGMGFSTCVYYERVMEMLQSATWESQCAPPTELISTVDITMPEGAFFPLGKLPFAVGTPSGTTLRKSAITDCCIETFTKPAHLRPVLIKKDGEEILWDPLMKGLEKCGTVLKPLSQSVMDIVSHDVARVYSNATPQSRERRTYTIEEAVFGIEGDEYFKSLTASTSPGFPWGLVKEPRMAGKRTWINLDGQSLTEDIVYHVEKRIEFASAGRRYPTLWMDLLKDERRPIEKVDQGKTRVFSGSPIDFTIACRMYFGAFVAAQAEGRIVNESLVGTNCYNFDWNLLGERLLKHGDNIIAGDYSNWDGSVSAQLLFAALDVINSWYGNDPEGNKIRQVLMMDIAYSTHVVGNSVYMWTHSMPSGVYLTATVNTIIGQMLMRIFYLESVPKEYANMQQFEANVRIAIYGDDNVVGVSRFIKKWFNQQTITEAATRLGMTYTDEQKTGKEVPPTRSLKDVTLLKRHFVYSDSEGRWVGPLQLRTTLDIPNWYRRDNPEDVVLPLIVECTLRELALHPKPVFLENRRKIEDAMVAACKRVPAMADYDSLRYSMLNGYRTITGKYL